MSPWKSDSCDVWAQDLEKSKSLYSLLAVDSVSRVLQPRTRSAKDSTVRQQLQAMPCSRSAWLSQTMVTPTVGPKGIILSLTTTLESSVKTMRDRPTYPARE